MLCIVLANLALVNCHPLFGFNLNKWINPDALKPASFDDEVSDYQVEFEERNETKKSGDLMLMANNSSDSNNETFEISSFTLQTSTISPVNVSTTTTTMSTTSSSTTYRPSSNSTETSTRTTLQPSVTTLASTSTSTMDPKKMTDFFIEDEEPIPNAFNFSADGLTTSHPSTTQMPTTSMRPSMTMFSATSTPSTRHQTGPAVPTPTSTSPNNTTPNNQINININSDGKTSSGAGAFRLSALAGILIVFTSCRLF